MTAIIYQHDEPPIVLEDIQSPILIEGDDITIRNFEGRTTVNINDLLDIRLVA